MAAGTGLAPAIHQSHPITASTPIPIPPSTPTILTALQAHGPLSPCKGRHGKSAHLFDPSVPLAEALIERAAQISHDHLMNNEKWYWMNDIAPTAQLLRLVHASNFSKTKREIATKPIPDEATGQCLGVTWTPDKQPYCGTHHNAERIINLINHILDDSPDGKHYRYTSIQINGLTGAAIHTDRHNLGIDKAIALGPRAAGWLLEISNSDPSILLDTHFITTNGHIPHLTVPHVGLRYSIILYTHHAANLPNSANALQIAQSYGIRLPNPDFYATNPITTNRQSSDDALFSAAQRYTAFCDNIITGATSTTLPSHHAPPNANPHRKLTAVAHSTIMRLLLLAATFVSTIAQHTYYTDTQPLQRYHDYHPTLTHAHQNHTITHYHPPLRKYCPPSDNTSGHECSPTPSPTQWITLDPDGFLHSIEKYDMGLSTDTSLIQLKPPTIHALQTTPRLLSPLTTRHTLSIYIDGSGAHHGHRATWALAVLSTDHTNEWTFNGYAAGDVTSDPNNPHFYGADADTSGAPELTAQLFAALYILSSHNTTQAHTDIQIKYDSTYAASIASLEATPHRHPRLASIVTSLYTTINQTRNVQWIHV